MAWHVDVAWLRWLLKFGANDADDAWLGLAFHRHSLKQTILTMRGLADV